MKASEHLSEPDDACACDKCQERDVAQHERCAGGRDILHPDLECANANGVEAQAGEQKAELQSLWQRWNTALLEQWRQKNDRSQAVSQSDDS